MSLKSTVSQPSLASLLCSFDPLKQHVLTTQLAAAESRLLGALTYSRRKSSLATDCTFVLVSGGKVNCMIHPATPTALRLRPSDEGCEKQNL